jgi:glycosidase
MATAFPLVAWATNTNIYEVNIRQYTSEGTFNAFAKHLPRLKNMGVEILWFMPLTPISKEKRLGTLGSYYATSCYTDINPEFGSAADLKSLFQQCHQLGMKVIVDWVANHTGADHKWVNEHPSWYQRDENNELAILHGWADVYHLDYNQPGVEDALIQAMKHWIHEYDIDGFRCDMAHLVPLNFWNKARAACDKIKHLFWLAETEDVGYETVFDATYAWQWLHASKAKVRNEITIESLKNILHSYISIEKGSYKMLFTSNHDENSWNGTEYERYGDAAKMLAVFNCLFKGIPLVYSGQEKPNLQRLSFFDKDEIDWNGDLALFDFYKRLLEIRKSHASFNFENYRFLQTESDAKVLAFINGNETSNLLAIVNFSSEQVHVNVEDEWLKGKYKYLFTEVEIDIEGKYYCRLPAFSFNVLCSA